MTRMQSLAAFVETLAASVRPVVTYALITVVVGDYIVRGKGGIEGKDVLLLATAAFAFWFGERSALKQPMIRCPLGCPVCMATGDAPRSTERPATILPRSDGGGSAARASSDFSRPPRA